MRQSNVVVGVEITHNSVHLQSKRPIDSSQFSIAPAMEWPSKMLFLSTLDNVKINKYAKFDPHKSYEHFQLLKLCLSNFSSINTLHMRVVRYLVTCICMQSLIKMYHVVQGYDCYQTDRLTDGQTDSHSNYSADPRVVQYV